jgi:hypothetical protein
LSEEIAKYDDTIELEEEQSSMQRNALFVFDERWEILVIALS